MIVFTEDIVIYWEQKTEIEIGQFLFDYFDFFKQSYPVIHAFYTGNALEVDSKHIQKLHSLIDSYVDIEGRIISKRGIFDNLIDSEIIEQLADFYVELIVVTKLNKFLRSNIVNPAYSKLYEFPVNLKQSTVEELSASVLGSSDYDNDWVSIAEKNDLQEFEYLPNDGTKLLVSVPLISKLTPINSVVDVITGQTVLGKDIKKKLTWKDDDLQTLDYEKTFEQTTQILLDLQIGDIPEFRSLGRSVFPGSSMKMFAFSPLLRQISQTFSTDDSIQRFNINKIEISGGDITFEVEVYSRLDEVINKQITV